MLIATTNTGKMREFAELLIDLPINLRDLNEFADLPAVAETGATFAENAGLKAAAGARATNLRTLADDSGLEVAALNSRPGVLSARYGGESLSDAERCEKLLSELDKTNDSERRARFVCVIACADERGVIEFVATGACSGTIARKPLGTNGFGYDAIFIPTGFEQTFGELSRETKAKISHRARAARETKRFLQRFFKI